MSCQGDVLKRGRRGCRQKWLLFFLKKILRRWSRIRHSIHEKDPNQQRWYAKWKLSRNTYTLHTRLCTFGCQFCMLSRCLVTKFLASELSRKFTKSVLLVGKFFPKFCQQTKVVTPLPSLPSRGEVKKKSAAVKVRWWAQKKSRRLFFFQSGEDGERVEFPTTNGWGGVGGSFRIKHRQLRKKVFDQNAFFALSSFPRLFSLFLSLYY